MHTSDVMGSFLNQSPKADHKDASADVSISHSHASYKATSSG
jgi:hypothetical protein